MWQVFRKTSALALTLALLTVAAVGCTGNDNGASKSEQPRPSAKANHGAEAHTASSKSDVPRPAQGAKEIVIDNFSFNPPVLTVPVGASVTWINHDDVPHTATSTAKPKRFDSGALDTDGQFTYVFTAPGTYDYFCAVHPKMTGQVIVK